jgi:hypothetical protein
MKKLFVALFATITTLTLAQTFEGLQGVYIEHYYQSSEEDNAAVSKSGDLPKGSKTYRVYLDLEPGYRFQVAYGSSHHPLIFQSSQPFFNHAAIGNTHPNVIPDMSLAKNITLLDSWLSAGAAGESYWGIPKKFDDADNQLYQKFEKGFLMNKTNWMDYSLQERDGMRSCKKLPVTTLFQLDSITKNLMMVTRSNKLQIDNGAWACMGKGAVGLDSLGNNYVLIAQLTTTGQLEFNLNIMIGTPKGTSIKYVWDNPQQGEVLCSLLKGTTKKEKRKKKKEKQKKQ